MSKKRNVSRKYHYTDAELKQVADKIRILVQRDAADFTAYGITLPDLSDYAALLAVFAAFPTDALLESQKIMATEHRATCRRNLETAMRYFFTIAKFCFRTAPSDLAAFGNPALVRQSAETLIRTARMIAMLAEHYLPQLTAAGLTAQHLHNLQTANAAFNDAISAQIMAVHNRTMITEERINTGNSLYVLITTLATAGKLLWRETDAVKYNNYLLY